MHTSHRLQLFKQTSAHLFQRQGMDAQQPEDFSSEDERVEITNLPGRTQPAHPQFQRQCQTRKIARLLKLRWLQLAALLMLAVLCLGRLLRSTPSLSPSLLSSFFGSTPTSEPDSQNINLFYISAGPGWAHLTIDDKPTRTCRSWEMAHRCVSRRAPIIYAGRLRHFPINSARFPYHLASPTPAHPAKSAP